MSDKDKEKKKIVFKANFSNQGNMPSNQADPQMVTEWNYMRITIAGLVLVILIAVGINFLRDKDESVTTENNVPEKSIQEAKTEIKPLATKSIEPVASKVKKQVPLTSQPGKKQASTKKSAPIYDGLVRAQLAKGIWENKPFGKITGSIKVNGEEATGIFYFTELENMKGKAVFHIWKYKGDVIFKKKRDIKENNWKTYTSKLFTRRSIGPWTVETVDSNDRQLNIIHFDVVSAK